MRMLRQWARHRRRHRRPLADHRQDAVAGPLRQLRLGHRRLQGDAGLGPRLRPHHRHATSRTRSTRRSALERFTHRPPDRRGGGGRRGALRTRDAADPLPVLRPARRDRVPLRRRSPHRAAPTRRRPTTPPGATTCSSATTPRACTSSAGCTSHGCGRWFNAARDTVSDRFLAVYPHRREPPEGRPMSGRLPPGRRAAGSTAARPLRFTLRRPALRRASPATRWPRRCSPTASTWSGAASSITGRAAS